MTKVIMETPQGQRATRSYKYSINGFTRLGKEIKISPKSSVSINAPGFKAEFFDETVSLVIGIGKDHSADLIMTKEAWDALNNGEEITIDSSKEFKKKYL